jgi:hypothetical protein
VKGNLCFFVEILFFRNLLLEGRNLHKLKGIIEAEEMSICWLINLINLTEYSFDVMKKNIYKLKKDVK